MGRFLPWRIERFGSLFEVEHPSVQPPNALAEAINCSEGPDGFGTRPGLVRESTAAGNYDAQISGAPELQGLYELRRRADGNGFLVSIAGGVARTDDTTVIDTTTNTIQITTGQDNRWTFMEHADNLYAAGGAATDHFWRWTGSGAATRVTIERPGPVAIFPKFVFEKWNFGFTGGFTDTVPESNPMIVRYSVLNDPTSWPTGNTIGGTSAIGGFDSFGENRVTGFGEYIDNKGDWLLVLTRLRLYSLLVTGDSNFPFYVDSAVQNGCVGQQAFVPLGLDSGDAIFVSESGIHSLRQSQQHGDRAEAFLSWPIRRTFDGLSKTRLKFASGVYDPINGRVLFLVAEAGSNTQNLILEMNIRDVTEITPETVRWRLWRLTNLTGNMLSTARDATNADLFIYIGTTNGNVLRFSNTNFSDLGVAYTTRWRTKDEDHGNPMLRKGFGDIVMDVTGSNTAGYQPTISFIFDNGRKISGSERLALAPFGTTWSNSTWGGGFWEAGNDRIQNKVYGVGSGHTTSLRFDHTGINQPFFVDGLGAQVRAFGESRGQE